MEALHRAHVGGAVREIRAGWRGHVCVVHIQEPEWQLQRPGSAPIGRGAPAATWVDGWARCGEGSPRLGSANVFLPAACCLHPH